uniref:ELMO domain-containing protein n=1 Tax=Arundo donax TaxID=35708 RepID=A0A0A9E768_ARUDO
MWKEMGWQNSDPATDFRAGGFMSLENLIYFARNYPDSFHRLLHKADGNRAEWEYPFAVASVNISYMLVQMLDLQSGEVNAMIAKFLLAFIWNHFFSSAAFGVWFISK